MLKMKNCLLVAITLLNTRPGLCYESEIQKKVIVVSPIACPCEYTFRPVCASDGVTYTNKCVLDCYNDANIKSGITPVYEIPDNKCSGCVCQNINLPVCTSDGQTYPNECQLSCENIRRIRAGEPIIYLAHRTACLGPPCECPKLTSPVCGSDNVLYRNLCELDCANKNAKLRGLEPIEFQNVGACLDGCLCPDIKEPVCGSDGATYDNPCQVACQNRQLSCSKRPPVTVVPDKVCEPCACPKIFDPVCGSDGKHVVRTFINPCELKCEAKRTHNPYLKIIENGPCPKCFCADIEQPVCGTDGKTYKNECELRCENEARTKIEPSISLLHEGPCHENTCDCSSCPEDYEPMCGSDEVTYLNMCHLHCYSHCRIKQGLSAVYLSEIGFCST